MGLLLGALSRRCAAAAAAGRHPLPRCAGTIEGLPVAELGAYCFADRPVRPGAGAPGSTHEITGNFVEEVTLPRPPCGWLDSAALQLPQLRRVTLGARGSRGLAADLFTNCRQLQTFRLRAAADAPTGLKKLLGAVSADITVELDGAQLFYPEYSEFLDENTPAHIFNHSIEGEGYRMRQCFTPGGAVDYAAFDASFAQACVGESEDKLCRLALGRLVQPFGLGDDARADYELYLTAHPEAAFRRAIDDRDEAALRLLVGLSLRQQTPRSIAPASGGAPGRRCC